MDYRRRGAARTRAGYSRLLASSTLFEFTQTISDDFTGSDGDPLGANWTQRLTSVTRPTILTNAAAGNAGASFEEYTGTSIADDQYATVRVPDASTLLYGLCIRLNANGGYMIDRWGLLYRLNTSANGLDELLGQMVWSLTTGDIINLTAIADRIYAFKNGILSGSVKDSTFSSGGAGIYFGNGEILGVRPRLDQFRAGTASIQNDVVKSDQQPTHIYAFERDDEQSKLLVARGGGMDEFDAGTSEWTS